MPNRPKIASPTSPQWKASADLTPALYSRLLTRSLDDIREYLDGRIQAAISGPAVEREIAYMLSDLKERTGASFKVGDERDAAQRILQQVQFEISNALHSFNGSHIGLDDSKG